jgi:hypothetical protein
MVFAADRVEKGKLFFRRFLGITKPPGIYF